MREQEQIKGLNREKRQEKQKAKNRIYTSIPLDNGELFGYTYNDGKQWRFKTLYFEGKGQNVSAPLEYAPIEMEEFQPV